MPFQVSPGVNVSEIDLTTIVPAVATSLAGISFPTEWGPANEPVLIDTPKEFRRIFGDIKEWNAANYMTALNFMGYSRGLLMVRAMDPANARNANTGGITDSNASALNDQVDLTTKNTLGFVARYGGEKGDSLAVSVASFGVTGSWSYYNSFGRAPGSTENLVNLIDGLTTNDQIHVVVLDEDGLFTGTKNEVLERFENVSMHPRARRVNGESLYYKNVINNTSEYIKVSGSLDASDADKTGFVTIFGSSGLGLTTVNSSNWETEYDFGTPTNTPYKTVSLTGGTGQDFKGNRTSSEQGKTIGYAQLADAEKIDVNLILSGDITGSTEIQELKGLVETRKDAIAFFSAPIGREGKNVTNKTDSEKADLCVSFKSDLGSSSYCIVDSGYKKQFDPYTQVNRWVPLNGDTAGLVARTEANRDAWFSPAGYNRGILRDSNSALGFNPSKVFRDRIYAKGINPIITERNTGTILLGDKTALSKPSAFDRINVRRLFIVLEKAIATASKYSLFEFNDAFTRGRFVSLVSPFLEDVKARRGLIDFKVVCDTSNNTPERIDRNEFYADIYIKPNRSINYVQLNFIATRSGASFSEVGG